MRRFMLLVVCTLLPLRSARARQSDASPPVTHFYVPRSWGDTLPAVTGEVRVIVRDVWSPNQSILGADVQLDGPAMLLHGRPDTSGFARFAALTPGYYKVRVRAIGYVTYLQEFNIAPGCATWIEVYLTINPCDIGACPPIAQPRATVTTCAPRKATRPPPRSR
jgi:hypothetical protein